MAHIQNKRGEGRGWVARYRTPDGRERSKTFPRKVDAERFLNQVEVDKARGRWVDPRLGRVTLAEWHEDFLATTGNLRASTRARDESYTKNHVLPRFGSTPIAAIDHLAVRTWVAELSATGKAPATVHKIFQNLSKPLAAAVDAGLISHNPCERVPLPKIERAEQRFLAPIEVATLTEKIDPRYSALIVTAAYSGLRIGELLGLKRSRVDLLQRRLTVVETLSEVKGKLITSPPKTRAGFRSVPIPRLVADALNDHVVAERIDSPDAYLFTSPHGGPIRLSQFRSRFWQPAVERAELTPLRIHDLRHTAVALWIAAGASPREIASRAGHSSVVTVLDRYGHLLPGSEDHVNDALDLLAEQANQATGTDGSVTPLRRPSSG